MSDIAFQVDRAESHDTRISSWRVILRGTEYYVTQSQAYIRDTGERIVHNPVVTMVSTRETVPAYHPTYRRITSLIRKDAQQQAA